jgi:hypothetical protein
MEHIYSTAPTRKEILEKGGRRVKENKIYIKQEKLSLTSLRQKSSKYGSVISSSHSPVP